MEREQSTGTLMALLSAFFLSFTGILIRRITLDYALPPLVLATWRNLFTSAAILLFLLVRGKAVRVTGFRELRFYFGYGLLLTCFNLFWTFSVILNGATIATILVYTSTLFTVLLDRILHGLAVTRVSLGAALLSLLGCYLLQDPTGGSSLPGALVGVGSGLAFALYSAFGRNASTGSRDSWTTLALLFGLSGGVMATATFALRPLALPWAGALFQLGGNTRGWALLLLLAAGPTLLGYGFYTAALAKLPSSVVNLLATCEPVFTAVIAFFYLQERLQGKQLFGGATILLAVSLVRLGGRRLQPA